MSYVPTYHAPRRGRKIRPSYVPISGGAPTPLEQLLERMRGIRDGLLAFGENLNGEATPEQRSQWEWFNAELDHLDEERQRLEALETRMASLRAAALDPGNVTPGTRDAGMDTDPLGDPASLRNRGDNPWDLSSVRTLGRPNEEIANELRPRALRAIERMQGTTDRRREVATRFIEEYDDAKGTIAQHVLLTSSPEYLRAFGKIMRGHQHLLTAQEQQAISRAMSLTDAAGGYMVPFQLDPTLIITSDGSVNPIRQLARKVIATGDVWNGVSAGHTAWSWDAEAAEASDDTSTFAQPTVPVYKAVGFIPISIEALADIPNVTGEVARLLAGGKDDLEATAFVVGTGSGQPTGIVTALAGGSSEVASATTDVFAVADVYNTEEPLPARYRDRSAWIANWRIYNDIRQFGTADSHALFARLADGTPEKLLGHPRYEASAMDGVINATADNRVLVLGDWDNFVVADRLGMTVETIPHLVGTNHRPTGQRGWFAYYRVGSDSVNDGAFRMLNVT